MATGLSLWAGRKYHLNKMSLRELLFAYLSGLGLSRYVPGRDVVHRLRRRDDARGGGPGALRGQQRVPGPAECVDGVGERPAAEDDEALTVDPAKLTPQRDPRTRSRRSWDRPARATTW